MLSAEKPLEKNLYPVPRAEGDKVFNFGLVYDVAKVIEAAGLPPIRTGADLVRLQMALYRFVYRTADDDAR